MVELKISRKVNRSSDWPPLEAVGGLKGLGERDFCLPLSVSNLKGGAVMVDVPQLLTEEDRKILRDYLIRRLEEVRALKKGDEDFWLGASMELEMAMDELLGEEPPEEA